MYTDAEITHAYSRTKIKARCEYVNIINKHHLQQWETTEQQAIEK